MMTHHFAVCRYVYVAPQYGVVPPAFAIQCNTVQYSTIQYIVRNTLVVVWFVPVLVLVPGTYLPVLYHDWL